MSAEKQVIHLMNDGGRIVSCAVMEVDPSISDNKTLNFLPFEFASGFGKDFELANKLVGKGEFKPSYESEHPFTAEGLIEALEKIWHNNKKGRHVIKIK